MADRLPTIVGFAGALAVLAGLVWFVGVDDFLDSIAKADLSILAVVVCIALLWLMLWGMALKTVLDSLGAPVPAHVAILVFAAAVFSNNITPFGQAGGEPVSALLISEAADTEYETGLAAIASVDTLHFVPSIGFAIGGFTFVAAGAVQLGRNLLFAAAAIATLAVALPVGAYLGWRYRYELEAAVVRVLTPVVQTVGRIIPRWTPPLASAIEDGIEGFFTSIDRIAADRRSLLTATAFSALGWLMLGTALWLSLYALGHTVPFSAVMLAIPVSMVAGVMPLPGGSGAIETLLVTMLVPTTRVPSAVLLSAVLLYRGATYWLPIMIGGGVASAIGADRARDRS
jgi:uncharacterized protein (TIRG00374 family)